MDDYEIRAFLGRGGIGEVWLADQIRPLRRQLALKVLTHGCDEAALSRFAYEQRTVARLQHPYIANAYDAGTTRDGRPFFVMEYIAGAPITEFCDEHALSLRDRLELFDKVCDAVQYAHNKGVIHRDIKPSNVLVTVLEETATPKVIDFGIARAVAAGLRWAPERTRQGDVLGTPCYMSPEQASGAPDDVDTRSDVYSLGVLFYELLTGQLPIEIPSGGAVGWEEVLKRLRDLDPDRPSERIEQRGSHGRRIAAARGFSPHDLATTLRQELDWIALKALAKNPAERYASAGAFADDIRRYLAGDIVGARPPTLRYRVTKLARRHRTAVAIAGSIAVFVVVLAIVMTIQAARIARERDRANAEALAAREVSEFLTELFESEDPRIAQGTSLTARELVDRGTERINRQLTGQPALQARLMHTLGTVNVSLGAYEDALRLLEEGLTTRQSLFGERHTEVADSLVAMASLQNILGAPQEAEPLLRRAVEIRRELVGEQSAETADALSKLAETLWYKNDVKGAKPLYERVLKIRNSVLGADDAAVGVTLKDLGDVALVQGRFTDARALFEEALGILQRRQGVRHPNLIPLLTNYAWTEYVLRHDDAAEPLAKRALALSVEVLGEGHPAQVGALCDYGLILVRTGRADEARALFERSLEIAEGHFEEPHRDIALSLDHLGLACLTLGDLACASRSLERALTNWTEVFGRDSLDAAMTLHRLGSLSAESGDPNAADAYYSEALAIREDKLPAIHPEIAELCEDYSVVLLALGDQARAEELEERAAGIWQRLR